MAESTSSCVSDDRLSRDIETPGTSGSSSEQVLHDVEQPAAVSLLSRFRAPSQSELSRKRKCVSNPPSGKRKNSGSKCSTEPKSVKPEQRVREYPNEPFVVSNSALFCSGCREELCVKSSSVKNHCHSAKHLEGKQRLAKKQAREGDIAEALLKYNKEVHPHGETLPSNQQVFRVKVVRTFLKAGVPFSKIDLFCELLEETAFRQTVHVRLNSFCPQGRRSYHQE